MSSTFHGFDISKAPDFTAIAIVQMANTQAESTTHEPRFDWHAIDYSALEYLGEFAAERARLDTITSARRSGTITGRYSGIITIVNQKPRHRPENASPFTEAIQRTRQLESTTRRPSFDWAAVDYSALEMRVLASEFNLEDYDREYLNPPSRVDFTPRTERIDPIITETANRFQELFDGVSLFESEYDQGEESEMPYINNQYLHRALGELLIRSAVVNSNIEVNRNLPARAYDIHIRVSEGDLNFRDLDLSPSLYEANTEYVIQELVRNLEQTRLSEHGRLRKLLEAIKHWIKEANTTESWDRLRKEIELAENMLAFNPLKGQTFEQSIATPHEETTVKAGSRRIKLGKKSKDGI